jgi:excisionase family DNA binding protein
MRRDWRTLLSHAIANGGSGADPQRIGIGETGQTLVVAALAPPRAKIAISGWSTSHRDSWQPVFLTVTEAARTMSQSRPSVLRQIHSGQLRSLRLGRTYRIPDQHANRILADGSCDDMYLTAAECARILCCPHLGCPALKCVAAPGHGALLIPGGLGSRDPLEERERRGDDRE